MRNELFKGVSDCLRALVRIYFVATYRCIHYVVHLPSYKDLGRQLVYLQTDVIRPRGLAYSIAGLPWLLFTGSPRREGVLGNPAFIHPHTYPVRGSRQAGLFTGLPRRVLLGNPGSGGVLWLLSQGRLLIGS